MFPPQQTMFPHCLTTRIACVIFALFMCLGGLIVDTNCTPLQDETVDFGERNHRGIHPSFLDVRPQIEKRFPKMLTCTTDLDCLELDRPTCCVRSRIGNHRVCKPLGGLFDQCNLRSQAFPWFGVREGYYCPCSIGLQCDNPGRLGERRRGQCGF